MKRNLLVAIAFSAVAAKIEQFFSQRGFRVDVAHGGVECLGKVRHQVPDALVLDWDLPWGGGAGVLACLREAHATAKVPVILVAGRFLSEVDVSAPFNPSLQIPGDVGSLYDAVDTVLASTDLATGAITAEQPFRFQSARC